MAVLTSTGITFGDGTTQASGSAFGSIGTYAILFNYSRSSAAANSTAISSSSLGYVTGPNSGTQGYRLDQRSARSGNVTVPGAAPSGYANTAAVSGTWRTMSGSQLAEYDPCFGYTFAWSSLYVRVS